MSLKGTLRKRVWDINTSSCCEGIIGEDGTCDICGEVSESLSDEEDGLISDRADADRDCNKEEE
jgi:hypothetical protein